MNSLISRSLRFASLASTLFVLPLFSSAKESASPESGPSVGVLAGQGAILVKAARRNDFDHPIEVGSGKESVSYHLGKPSVILRDGTWLYRDFTVDGSVAKGTLVVAFNYSHVRQLSLVGPGAEMALIDASQKLGADKALVASAGSR
jgi:hypothetical protein